MGRHEQGLRPATVEELAAAERADRSPRPERIKRPIVILFATVLLLAAGAGAFALAHNDSSQPTFKPPLGDAAPFGVGYVDGFGEHMPVASPSGKPKPKPPKAPSFAAPASPTTNSPTHAALVAAPTATPSASGGGRGASQAPSPQATVDSGLSAVYWTVGWRNTFYLYVWVHNDAAGPAQWQVTMQLQPGATISTFWAASGVNAGLDSWQFAPTESLTLGPGSTYLFAVEARRNAGPFSVNSCSVNGVSCTPFG